LSVEQQQELLRDARFTTDWIATVIRKIVQAEEELVKHG
jgi:hypothetical protein